MFWWLKSGAKGTDEEIEQLLAEVDLADKADTPAENLSGGQKRKLCVAIAFTGQSKVVLLFSPQAGPLLPIWCLMDTHETKFCAIHQWSLIFLNAMFLGDISG